MGILLRFPHQARASTEGRGTSAGQGTAGQFSENQRIVRSSRLTWMSAPASMARSFLVSPSARQLTVERSRSLATAYACATASSCSMPDMTAISVKLPSKSTGILPQEVDNRSGYTTGMEPYELLELIEREHAKGRKYAAMEREAEVPPGSIQNLKKSVKNGTHRTKQETIDKLAAVVGGHGGGGGDLELLEAQLASCEAEAAKLRAAIETIQKVRAAR